MKFKCSADVVRMIYISFVKSIANKRIEIITNSHSLVLEVALNLHVLAIVSI